LDTAPVPAAISRGNDAHDHAHYLVLVSLEENPVQHPERIPGIAPTIEALMWAGERPNATAVGVYLDANHYQYEKLCFTLEYGFLAYVRS
jgi:hypothetical protein